MQICRYKPMNGQCVISNVFLLQTLTVCVLLSQHLERCQLCSSSVSLSLSSTSYTPGENNKVRQHVALQSLNHFARPLWLELTICSVYRCFGYVFLCHKSYEVNVVMLRLLLYSFQPTCMLLFIIAISQLSSLSKSYSLKVNCKLTIQAKIQ